MPSDTPAPASRADGYADLTPPPPRSTAAMPCSECKNILRTMYFSLDGRPLCTRCSNIYRTRIERGTGPAAMARAIMYGGGAAIAGAVGVSVVLMVFNAFRIISAIGVAYLVAKAIGKATANYGGRRYQILAVALTYAALGIAMLMPVFRAANTLRNAKAPAKLEARSGPAGESAAISDELHDPNSPFNAQREGEDSATFAARADSLAKADSIERLERTRANIRRADGNAAFADRLAGGAGAMLVGVIGLLFVLPILSSFSYGLYAGVISIFALGFGLKKAWELTALVTDYDLSGPFRVGEGPIPPTIGA